MRLSGKEQLVLELLQATGGREMYGLQMVLASGGRLSRGTAYVTLDRMEDKGLLVSRQEAPGPGVRGIPRRLYQVTGHGVAVYGAWQRWLACAASVSSPEPAARGAR
jgi:DNA-binding PadR family transcriptional regulator